jgi:hypothetical protein
MTAQEIRERSKRIGTNLATGQIDQRENLWILHEIAAQLAELNQRLEKATNRSVFEAVFGK